ncbi:MAG: Lrp/AsnC family transcriptional regulator [SAR202 cluster bacterium]|jgi:Lrp/AsnC family transcriptional regulator for asnA, asnC and gidA|nr:Lrp/AsnC family transcriptional regulator [SAR202 cluster bacterium]MDP6513687.1 Lrp/AsnC family transcriptional regulator [SAR202 cluster bacterium]MDP6715036.1 Lrp/AsnC family transcriptional regulator [SAR202 cluster bacterium]
MDNLDTKIVGILQKDGRASNAGIAREVGVSEGTVRRRLKRLVDDQIINVVALLDPSRLGYSSEAIVGIQVDPDKIDDASETISDLDGVSWVVVTTGAYDIFACIAVESAEDLGNFLRHKLGSVTGVRRTETFVNLAVKKRSYGVSI